MKVKQLLIILTLIFFFVISIFAEIKFEPIALTEKDEYLFNSVEILGGKEYNRTLFYGHTKENLPIFEAVSFFPEKFFFSSSEKKVYLQNRLGLYVYDIRASKIKVVESFPNYANKDEYLIYDVSKVSFAPNFKYMIYKVLTSNSKASIYLYDIKKNSVEEIIKDVEIRSGDPAGYWSISSKYFIYQKDGNIYYFSVVDHKRNKLLAEEWRWIGKVTLNNTRWTENNYLIWVEGNLIYRSDPNQFFTRSIYKDYLRQGVVIGKLPFNFDPAFDAFRYNSASNKFIIVKNSSTIFYYSLIKDLIQNPFLQLDEKTQFEECRVFDNGEAILQVKELKNGKVNNKLIILKRQEGGLIFSDFEPEELEEKSIHNYTISEDKKQIVVNTSSGAYCYDLASLDLLWKYEKEEVFNSVNIGFNEWILGGKYLTVKANPELNIFDNLYASSFENAGFIDDKISLICNGSKFVLDKTTKGLSDFNSNEFKLYKESKTKNKRLVSREINKGFYKHEISIKELYSGKLLQITGEPELRYGLYQPETELGAKYYYTPSPEKHEIALVFNCSKSSEGVFSILSAIDYFKIRSTFFINGIFMEINPEITKELVYFDAEIGNMFQYYINLTNNSFLIDKNFIRQGLSTNEEKFYKITKKNFSPIWHSPMYASNDSIIKYGEESGYRYVTYNLDSLDWVGKGNSELDSKLSMNNSELIERILKKVKPGQIIILSSGKNGADRSDWLFNDIDVLFSELIRAGYSFTTVSDILKKYRKD